MKEYQLGYGDKHRVSHCLECPACYYADMIGTLCCSRTGRQLPELANKSSGTIPDWCPLPEAKEEAH